MVKIRMKFHPLAIVLLISFLAVALYGSFSWFSTFGDRALFFCVAVFIGSMFSVYILSKSQSNPPSENFKIRQNSDPSNSHVLTRAILGFLLGGLLTGAVAFIWTFAFPDTFFPKEDSFGFGTIITVFLWVCILAVSGGMIGAIQSVRRGKRSENIMSKWAIVTFLSLFLIGAAVAGLRFGQ